MNVIFTKIHRIDGVEYYPGDAVGLLQPDAERLIASGVAKAAPEGTLLRRAPRDTAATLTDCVAPNTTKKIKMPPDPSGGE